MFRTFTTVLVFLALLLVADYASATKMKSFWKDPSAKASNQQFKKICVVAVIKQPLTRKVAEDKMVNIIEAGGRSHAVASYTVIADDQLDDKAGAKSKIEGLECDGLIIMHYSGSKDEQKYEDQNAETWYGYSYDQVWGYNYPGWGAVYNATSSNDLTVYIETMFYSIKENKLIWAGITQTKNPKNAAKVVGEIAEVTMEYLQKEGLIAKKK